MHITLAGCSKLVATTTATPNIYLTTTVTEKVEPTRTVTSTLIMPPTQTVKIEPTLDGSGVMLLGTGSSPGGYLINFQIPGIDRLHLVSVGGLLFKCEILTQDEVHLMCDGLMLQWGKTVEIQFIDPMSGQMVHNLNCTLPDQDYGFSTPAPPVCVNPNACPRRGEKWWCETKFHYDQVGNPCMVATCTDACGFCVGIDTHQSQEACNLIRAQKAGWVII